MAPTSTFSGEISYPETIFDPPLTNSFDIDLIVQDEILDRLIADNFYYLCWRWVLDLSFPVSLPVKVFAGNPNSFQLGHWSIWVGDYVVKSGFISYIKQCSPYFGCFIPQFQQPVRSTFPGVTGEDDREALTLPRNLLIESSATKASFLLVPGVEGRLKVPYSAVVIGGSTSSTF